MGGSDRAAREQGPCLGLGPGDWEDSGMVPGCRAWEWRWLMKWLRTWGPITSEPLYSLQLLRQGLSSVQGPRTVSGDSVNEKGPETWLEWCQAQTCRAESKSWDFMGLHGAVSRVSSGGRKTLWGLIGDGLEVGNQRPERQLGLRVQETHRRAIFLAHPFLEVA